MKVEAFDMTNMEEDEANEEDPQVSLPVHNDSIYVGSNHFSDCGGLSGDHFPLESSGNCPELCAGCHKPIFDKYYMWIDHRAWHEACVQCRMCGQALKDTCYLKDCNLYCRQDYNQLQKCKRCSKSISCNEMVRRVAGHSFHVLCFACHFCGRQLESGDLYITDEISERICCKTCNDRIDMVQADESNSDSEKSDDEVFCPTGGHLSHVGGPHYYPHPSEQAGRMDLMRSKNKSTSSSIGMLSASDKQRQKRPRTILTTAQRRKFKASFEVSQKPCRKVRETLAAETGLTPRVVQVWFQNQRAKVKKLARRQTQGDASGQDSSRGNRQRRKKTNDSDSDNEISSPGSYTSTAFHDSYRSPGSVHTSPTAASESSTSIFYSSSHQAHDSNIMYDDYDQHNLPPLDPGEDGFVTPQPPHLGTIGSTITPLELEPRYRTPEHLNDYNNNGSSGNMLATIGDANMLGGSPVDGFPQQYSGAPALPHFQAQTSADGNPIDRLMYMQNSYFRT